MTAAMPDAVAVLDALGEPRAWGPIGTGPLELDGQALSCGVVENGPWQVRAVRADSGTLPGLRLTGQAVTTAPHDPLLLTRLEQGVDLCVARPEGDGFVEDHSELRILIPYDAVVDEVRSRDDEGRVTGVPRASVRDVPAGYPVVVAVRRGAEPPAIPQVDEKPRDANGRPIRIWQTGSSIPQVEIAPYGAGHRIDVRWPDRSTAALILS
ncbi:hypothetical protein [Microbacterium luticocti]|uniref:hypothetical protein n=1 Tax=Microbacterium luticocti TaxID=451764 RepID=UPI00048DFC23|nr:hypothetical protein [Microbacterium luticocti]